MTECWHRGAVITFKTCALMADTVPPRVSEATRHRPGAPRFAPDCRMNTTMQAAPTFSLFGSFFPAWLVCAIAGIVGALVLRAVLSIFRLDDGIPFKLVTYTCAAVAIDSGLWLLLFCP